MSCSFPCDIATIYTATASNDFSFDFTTAVTKGTIGISFSVFSELLTNQVEAIATSVSHASIFERANE